MQRSHLHSIFTFLKSNFLRKKIHIGGKQPSNLSFATISLLMSDVVPFPGKDLAVSNIICDNKNLLIGLSNGTLYNMSWKGEFYGSLDLDFHLCNANGHTKLSNGVVSSSHSLSRKSAVIYYKFSLPLRLLFVLFSDGQLVLCSVSKRGLKQSDCVNPEYRLGSDDAVCASIAPDQQILAVGTRRGVIELYEIGEPVSLIRSVSLHNWGCAVVTAANKGIGFEMVRQLAASGVTVVLTARNEKRGTEARSLLHGLGLSNVLYHRLDVQDLQSIQALANFIQTQFGKLDILVNNAGASGVIVDEDGLKALNIDPASWLSGKATNLVQGVMKSTNDSAKECIDTNYYGVKNVTRALLPLLERSTSGARIVNVSSLRGELWVRVFWVKYFR